VPGNAVLHFTLRGYHKYRTGLQQVLDIKSAVQTSNTRDRFPQLGRLMLQDDRNDFRSRYLDEAEAEARTSVRKEVAILAVERGNFDLYDHAVATLGSQLPMQSFHHLGRKLASTGLVLSG
jgi:hypothetical protein